MTDSKVSVLLGRPLSSTETENFKTYLELAQQKVSDVLCTNICAEHETKKFQARKGYRTLNVPIFTEITSVKVAGVETDAFETYQGSSLNGDWFNSIVFDSLPEGMVEIEADWGFLKVPLDVQQLVAEQFAIASSSSLEDDTIRSKQVEDFNITFNGNTKQDAFAQKYAATIAKYSACLQGNVQHGASHGHLHIL